MEMATERIHAKAELESERTSSPAPAPEMAGENHAFAHPVQRSARLLSSPLMRSANGGGVRALALRQAQQGYGNRYAQRVMRRHTAAIQRQCSCGGSCDACKSAAASMEARPIQRQAANPAPGATPTSVIPESNHGEALDETTLADMRGRFGRDFSDVRVHSDGEAIRLVQQADHLPTRRDIYFASGQYQPATREGRRLLAHELTHVVQQSEGVAPANTIAMHAADGVVVGHPDDPLEREAEHNADRVTSGGAAHVSSGGAVGLDVQRQSATPTPAPPSTAGADAVKTVSDAINNDDVGAAVPPLRGLSVEATADLRKAVNGSTGKWMMAGRAPNRSEYHRRQEHHVRRSGPPCPRRRARHRGDISAAPFQDPGGKWHLRGRPASAVARAAIDR